MRSLLTTETEVLKKIARIHELMPKAYDKKYSATELDIKLRYESMSLLMMHRNDQILLIEDDNTLCAFLWYHIGDVVHIKSTYVDPKFRNLGLATQLKRQIEIIAKENHINTIYSDVHPSNIAMIRLNGKLGYTTMMNRTSMIKTIEV
ncbi:GNAT family N-acetyltransferase [Macrococcus sp. EM39E]|uniref:GNAT family N-acetyltransferase n=1 Tax=Macrococcus animalis TaxID=3395467 RepID=UPI0039BE08B4